MMSDAALEKIAEYVLNAKPASEQAYDTARLCLADSLGCAIAALKYPDCTKLLGPVVKGTTVPNGAKIPGTSLVLDPILAAFNLGTMIRWLDYNDTWLAAEWGHPSDNIGGILTLADFLTRNGKPLTIRDVLTAMIKAYEIQGILSLKNSYNRIGIDHVIFVEAATAAVCTHLLGGTKSQICDALSNAFIDVGPLRLYRHAPNTGSRKSWAAGDATSRGVKLSLMTMQGEMGYPQALTAKNWGLYDVLFNGVPFELSMPFDSYVMENILFKVSYPAEFHAQTAIECAVKLHEKIKDKFDQIKTIKIETHEAAIRIINKTGPLKNPSDRDHCLQYMVACALIKGTLDSDDYHEETARNPLIDQLRDKMTVIENTTYSQDYLNPEKRSIANKLSISFKDGSSVGPIAIEYPIGHKKRRKEAIPLLFEKLEKNLSTKYSDERNSKIFSLFQDNQKLDSMLVSAFVEWFD